MNFKERWTKEFSNMLTVEEKEAFNLWLDFSRGNITESEFQSKMNMKIMPKMLGKMSAARMNALEDEVERLGKRVAKLEEKMKK